MYFYYLICTSIILLLGACHTRVSDYDAIESREIDQTPFVRRPFWEGAA